MTEKNAQAIIGFTMLIYFAVLIAGVVVMKRAMDYYKHEYQQCIVRQMPDGLIKNLDIGK